MISAIAKIPTQWKPVISEWFRGKEGKQIEENIRVEQTTFGEILPSFPSLSQIFRCFHYVHPQDIKAVILGQDPYHGPHQAIGLCFGVTSTTKNPPSLRNIEKELQADLGIPLDDSTLEKWAKQGVLLLNAALTVRQQTPLSHMKWWHPFTDFIIEYLNKHGKGVVFVAWGAFAHKKLSKINLQKHHLLISSHPSPLSASRPYRQYPSFKGSQPFSRINGCLQTPIAW